MRILLVPLALVLLPVAFGGEMPALTITSAGSAKTLPTALQVWLTLKEKGADAAAAVQALKADQEKIAAKLTPAGIKAELKSDVPAVVDKNSQDAMMRRMRGGGGRLKRTPKTEEKPEIELQQTVRFLVPLEAKDATALLVEAEGWKARLNALKLVEEKPAEADAGDEENNYNQYDNGQNRGPVAYVYYAPLSEDLRSQAIADAIRKAKEEAQHTARAIGLQDVTLVSLTVVSTREEQEANPYQYQYDRYGRPISAAAPSDGGVVSQTPQINVVSRVQAGFNYK